MSPNRSRIFLAMLVTLIGSACIAVAILFSTMPPKDYQSEVTIASSRNLDGKPFVQVTISSALQARELTHIAQSNRTSLQAIVDSITPQHIENKGHLRSIRRAIIRTLGPDARTTGIRIRFLPTPSGTPLPEDIIRKLPGTLGYTHEGDPE